MTGSRYHAVCFCSETGDLKCVDQNGNYQTIQIRGLRGERGDPGRQGAPGRDGRDGINGVAVQPVPGVTVHDKLTGLESDDHHQYHNDARGDARYYTKSEIDARVPSEVSAAANGYVKLNGDLLLQWGKVDSLSTTTTTVTFPVPFTQAVYSVTVTKNIAQASAVWAAPLSLTQATIGNTGTTAGVYWMAIGK